MTFFSSVVVSCFISTMLPKFRCEVQTASELAWLVLDLWLELAFISKSGGRKEHARGLVCAIKYYGAHTHGKARQRRDEARRDQKRREEKRRDEKRREEKTRQDKTRQDKTRQDKKSKDKTRAKTRQEQRQDKSKDKTRAKTRQEQRRKKKTTQDKTREHKTR
jgi:hypothetical protein